MEFQECSAYARQDAMIICLYINFATLRLQSCAQWLEALHGKSSHMVIRCLGLTFYTSDVMISCDGHGVMPKFVANIVVALVSMCVECWLA